MVTVSIRAAAEQLKMQLGNSRSGITTGENDTESHIMTELNQSDDQSVMVSLCTMQLIHQLFKPHFVILGPNVCSLPGFHCTNRSFSYETELNTHNVRPGVQ